MATKPRFNPQRRAWQVQYKGADGKWHREIVGRAPARWKEGEPEPKMPPEVHARTLKLIEKEKEIRASQDRGVPDSLASFLDDHLARYQKETTRDTARRAVDDFMSWCRTRGIRRRAEVDADVCDDYIGHLAGSLAINTVRSRCGYIAAAWGRLAGRGKIARNPWSKLEIRGQARTKPRNAWTPEQFEKLLAAAAPWLRDVLVLGTQTGLRIGSMRQLTWDDWKKPQSESDGFGYIDVRTEICKTAGYMVPVSRMLNDLLIRRFGKHHPEFILTGMRGKPMKSRQHTDICIRLACERAGLPRPESPNHHMRRTFGRWAIMGYLTGRPVPIYIVSQWMGHATIDMSMRYLGLEKRQSVQFMVPDLMGPAPTTEPPTPPSASDPS